MLSEHSDQLAHPRSVISLLCTYEEALGTLLPIEQQTVWLHRLSLGAHDFVGFVILQLIFDIFIPDREYRIQILKFLEVGAALNAFILFFDADLSLAFTDEKCSRKQQQC